MIISRTPYRLSFLGGGTDYPSWYRSEGGAVLSTTIDKYSYLTCRPLPPFFGYKFRVVWRHIETVGTISEILHPAVRGALNYLGLDETANMEIHHQGDLPSRSGIGSSSSFSVGLINALLTMRGEVISKHDLAMKALELEQDILKESVGSQDQVAAAYGGFNLIRFSQDGSHAVEPLDISGQRLQDLQNHLLFLYTGSGRMASDIAARVIANTHVNADALRKMRNMVDAGAAILQGDGSLEPFGELLHEAWILKRSLADGVTNSRIDRFYEIARSHGAVGGKITGAGGAGFMLFFVPPERQHDVKNALEDYLWVPFAFDNTGSTIIYNDSVAEASIYSRDGTASPDVHAHQRYPKQIIS